MKTPSRLVATCGSRDILAFERGGKTRIVPHGKLGHVLKLHIGHTLELGDVVDRLVLQLLPAERHNGEGHVLYVFGPLLSGDRNRFYTGSFHCAMTDVVDTSAQIADVASKKVFDILSPQRLTRLRNVTAPCAMPEILRRANLPRRKVSVVSVRPYRARTRD